MNDSKGKKKKKIERPDWWYMLHPTEQSEEEWWSSAPGLNVLTTFLQAMTTNYGFQTRIMRYMVHTLNIRSWLFTDETLHVFVSEGLSDERKEEIKKHVTESVIETTVREMARRIDMPVNLIHYILSRLNVRVLDKWREYGGDVHIDNE